MSVTSNNATAPSPAIAPGAEHIDPAGVARTIGTQGVDPRLSALIPAFDAPFFQAGLAGYSDAAMRLIARAHGCPFCVTEALLDRTLLAGGRGFDKADLGELHDNIPGGIDDHPLACQIMGSDPKEMAAAALKCAEQAIVERDDKYYRYLAYQSLSESEINARIQQSRADRGECCVFDPAEGLGDDDSCETTIDQINTLAQSSTQRSHLASPRHSVTPSLPYQAIDVNLACPVKKIKSKARGGHWLAEPEGAIEILRAVREAVPATMPCTVKLRRSYDDTPEMVRNFEIIFNAAYELGYAWTTVHARTVEQKYIGPSRWTFLKDLVARHPDKLVFGSGDVWEAADIFRMIAYTGVAAVSVARGCIGNPWVFRQARQMMLGQAPTAPTIAEQRAVLEEHFRLAVRVQGEEVASRTMRKFAIRFAAHHPRADDLRRAFIAVENTDAWLSVLHAHYSEPAPT